MINNYALSTHTVVEKLHCKYAIYKTIKLATYRVPIKTSLWFLVITYANVDRFSKFFHNRFPRKLSMYLWRKLASLIHYVDIQSSGNWCKYLSISLSSRTGPGKSSTGYHRYAVQQFRIKLLQLHSMGHYVRPHLWEPDQGHERAVAAH